MDVKARDTRLEQFFTKDKIKQLDEAEKNALSEEYSNSELRLISSLTLDQIKSRVSRTITSEFQRRLSFIQPEEYPLLKDWYIENCHTVEEIWCTKCNTLIGLEVDTIDDTMNKHHHEGKFILNIGNSLMAYRPRLDGVMGYQCGNMIVNEKAKGEWSKFETKLKEVAERYDADMADYKVELKKWEALPENKKAKTPAPTEPTPEKLTPPAEPKMVDCGNDTRWAKIEEDNIPESHVMTSLTKDDRIKVKREMDAQDYSPDVQETKKGRTIESFELRKVK